MEATLPMVTFVLLTTGLSIIALGGLIFSDWYGENRLMRATPKAPAATPIVQTLAPQQRRASAAQEFLSALKKAA